MALFLWRLVKKLSREALSATMVDVLRLCEFSHKRPDIDPYLWPCTCGGYPSRVQGPSKFNVCGTLVPRSAGSSRASLSNPAWLFLVFRREKLPLQAKSGCSCSSPLHQACTKLAPSSDHGMEMGRWSSNLGRRAVEAPLPQECELESGP
jgi:hypothetical protein